MTSTRQKGLFSHRTGKIEMTAIKQMPIIAADTGDCVLLGQGVQSFGTPDHVINTMVQNLQATRQHEKIPFSRIFRS